MKLQSKHKHFPQRKCIWRCRAQNDFYIVQALIVRVCLNRLWMYAATTKYHWDYRTVINMAQMHILQMAVFLKLLTYMYMFVLNGTDQCQICQAPLTENPLVPWLSDLNDITEYFSGLRFKVMRVLLGNSFVSAPMMQVSSTKQCI